MLNRRFLRWAEEWAEANVRPGEGSDIESHEARAWRLADRCAAAARQAGFKDAEIAAELPRLRPIMLRALQVQTLHGGDDLDDDPD